MKRISTCLATAFLAVNLLAQAPQGMSYQAIVRNTAGLVVNTAVGMRISILQGSATGTAVYVETQTPTTNTNGLITLTIGAGTASTGTFAAIDWSTGIYFVKTEIDPAGGTNYTITIANQLLSVPYALYAGKAENGFSGNYNDLTNKPNLTDTSKFLKTETDPVFGASVAKRITASDTVKWNAKSNFSGSYTDLSNRPDTNTFVRTVGNQSIAGNKTFTGTITGTVNANNSTITNVATPINGNDATNKVYVDALKEQIMILKNTLVAGGMIADNDGNAYNIVKIGTQIWMSENLKVTTYNDSTIIPNVTNPNIWDTLTSGALCAFNNTTNIDSINTMGRFYNWYAVNTGKLCPTGWHVPSDNEWTVLVNHLSSVYGGDQSSMMIDALGPDVNKSGFSGIDVGRRDNTGNYNNDNGSWWSSTQFDTTTAYARFGVFMYDSFGLSDIKTSKDYGVSVRCLKN